MPEFLRIDNIGGSGLNSDLQPWSLPEAFITYGINFRVTGDSLQSTNANSLYSIPPLPNSPTPSTGHVLSVAVTNGDFWVIGTNNSVWAYDGGGWTDISSTAGYPNITTDGEFNWTSAMLGNIPIMNNPQAHPEYWSQVGLGQKLQPLNFSPTQTWLQADKNFKVIRSHNNFLFALGLTEGGVELPNSYRWSHPAAQNGLPFTWDETDISAIASIEQISGDSGEIVDGLSLRDSFCIYSERAINILDFTGGAYVFRNRELSNTYGLLNKNCIASVNGIHYFMSDADILINDGNSVKSIVYNRIRERFNALISSDYYGRSFVVTDKANKEIHFCVAEEASLYPNVAYVYNFNTDSWSIKDLPVNTAHGAYGPISTPSDSWDSITGTYDSTALLWSTTAITPLNQTIVVADALNGSLIVVSPLASDALVDTNSRIERTDYPLGGHDNVTTTVRVYPHMSGSNDVSIQFGSQQFAGAPVAWKPAVVFNPSTDRKIDIRVTGELLCWRIQTVGAGGYDISGMTLEFEMAGKR